MQRHWCNAERAWLDFESICSWCELTEAEARKEMEEYAESERRFQETMRRVEASARPDITDD